MTTGSERALRAIAPLPSRRETRRWLPDASMLLGAAAVVWSGGIHLDLWEAGYRSVPTIGWLFLVQALSAFVLGALVALTRRAVVAVAGALFLVGTALGLVWSVEWGLFGFQESFGAPFASESLGLEAAGAVVLAVACLISRRRVRLSTSAAVPDQLAR